MQKARRLMDENNVSFQMFLILLSSITLGSESHSPVFSFEHRFTGGKFQVAWKPAKSAKTNQLELVSQEKHFAKNRLSLN